VPVFDQVVDPLNVVATAVTPVVMVSATAILISGVNARYIAISDRVRSLAHEYRDERISTERRRNIRRQMAIFRRRLHLASWAARVLYAAAGCFVAVSLLISVLVSKQILRGAAFTMFLIGLILIALAIFLQLLELQESNKTIDLESADVLSDSREL
jgi:sorbitol-specific phosphotransferase system component IIBC